VADLNRREDLLGLVQNVDIIVHAAGLTRAKHDADYYAVNVEGTKRLAEAASAAGVGRFVLISSLAARGPDIPGASGDQPASPYGYSKLEAERAICRLSGKMETVVLRLAGVYGPRDRDLLPLFKMARRGWLTLPAGAGLVQLLYVADAAQATFAAASGPVSLGPLPVAEAGRHTWAEVTALLEGTFNRRVHAVRLPSTLFEVVGMTTEWTSSFRKAAPSFDRRRARDLAVHTWTCNPSRTEKALNWRAEVPLFEGLARTARWYKEVGWL
jgi:nucleoside-diphosphate-sugar epimerase